MLLAHSTPILFLSDDYRTCLNSGLNELSMTAGAAGRVVSKPPKHWSTIARITCRCVLMMSGIVVGLGF
ncbi:hypothetical protein CORC01_02451 [Colletotrichum orchidophilum]|uniref:Uncharacterized protein n=1 Tax=Colletotrichum orchidophilum TaxID=1209926 RepID=A0A1G4BL51_9PEZI|nr:uncharacterized protein CORC01_02451 [Colletotrichum orchidophilum]OHF02171.1 hypothetical protein CORC01_02451 [Colletotrichum orchidophilum]